MMVILNRTLRGVAKSLVIPIALVAGSVAYFALFDMPGVVDSSVTWEGLVLSSFNFDWGLTVAFVICFVALLINDIGSIESLGSMLKADDMPSRLKRGVRITGVMNIVAGSMGGESSHKLALMGTDYSSTNGCEICTNNFSPRIARIGAYLFCPRKGTNIYEIIYAHG